MELKEFSLAQILSVTTGKLLCPIDGIYKILNFMTGDNLFTHQLPRACDQCAPAILAQYPALTDVDASKVTPDNWESWLASKEKIFGESLPIFPLTEYECKDPILELSEMIEPKKSNSCRYLTSVWREDADEMPSD